VAARPLPEAIASSVRADLSVYGLRESWPAEIFARPPFRGGEWLILVDGLDELISARHRRAVLTKLAGVNAHDERIFRFVVATRPLAEDKNAIPSGWLPRCFELLPFTNGQFSKVATNWFKLLELPEIAVTVELFVDQVQDRELAEVARNPLMATILCQLFADNPDASLPPGRSRIFDAFEELLNSRQYSDSEGGVRYQLIAALAPFGKIAEEAGEKLLELAPEIIRGLAWHHISGDNTTTIDLIDKWLIGLKPGHVPVTVWHGVLRDLLRCSGVVQERAGDFVFFHQTIAEHLAAQYVAGDAERSDAEFRRLFNKTLWQDIQSYARFLVAAWSSRPDLPGTLSRVLEKNGLAGARFVASLRMDGIELPRELSDQSLDHLFSFAVDPKLPEPDRRAATETVLASETSFGVLLLASVIRTPSLDTSYRGWALERLAAARHRLSLGPTPRSVESALLHAMRSLVEYDDAEGRDLIAFVARDSSWPRQGREWAVQALLTVGEPVSDVLEPLIEAVRAAHPEADIQLIERAYDVAAYWHRGQTRISGDPYISRPLAVATSLAELGMNTETICAALLRDTVEDTPYTLTELRGEFGEDIAALVDSITKLDKVKYGEFADVETVRKMVVAMSRDIRVLVIKLADRLHNMRTLRYLPREKQERMAREVLEIFAPLARRLGMNTIDRELEDLAFATLYPKRFDEIVRLVSGRVPRREAFLAEMIADVAANLREAKIKASVTGHLKHYYSIDQKMTMRNIGIDEIYDLVGIRVLVDSVKDCYAALGIIHARWNPVPGRFKDYIAMPKLNMYQSLHTTVIGPAGEPVQLQIRTWTMHQRAENGSAAYWKYKEETVFGRAKDAAKDDTQEMAWLRQLVDWQRETEFPESLHFDLAAVEVYVFTVRGDVIPLPRGSTPVDFAYAIHAEVGHRTVGARVNGRLVALKSSLDNGDTVEIFTSKAPDAGPSRDWLKFVQSPRARNKIRQWFSKERREAAVYSGKDQIAKAMRKQGRPLQRIAADSLPDLARELRYADVSALYEAVGEGRISAQSVVEKLVRSVGGRDGTQEDLAEAGLSAKALQPQTPSDSGVEVVGAPDVWVRLSQCCTPVPGDAITGFVTHGHGVSVHRVDCVNLAHLTDVERERMVEVHWSPTEGSVFLVAIQVEALDRTRLLSDVTRVLSDQHVNILSATVTTSRDRVAFSRFTFEMGDPEHLGHVLRAVRAIDGVYDVYHISEKPGASTEPWPERSQ
jgi:GTP pyrophosphokinase